MCHLSRRPLLLLLLLLAATALPLSTATPSPSLDYDVTLSNCSTTFDCGPLRNLSYPFTGGARPAHCGPPEFRLTCLGNDSAKLTTGSMSYQVLELDQARRSLIISRSDLYNNTCLRNDYTNTTLNSTFFSSGPENEDLTIFYGCSTLMNLQPQNMFNCETNGSTSISYYLMGPIPNDPILNVSKCNVSVRVPILQSAVAMLTKNRSMLKEALMEGFLVNYTNPYDEDCSQCRAIYGECGFDSVRDAPICICRNRVCSVSGITGIFLGDIS